MDNENKWEYDYSSEHSQTGETGYPNVGSSGMNTANTAGTYGEAAQAAPQAEPNGGSDGGAVAWYFKGAAQKPAALRNLSVIFALLDATSPSRRGLGIPSRFRGSALRSCLPCGRYWFWSVSDYCEKTNLLPRAPLLGELSRQRPRLRGLAQQGKLTKGANYETGKDSGRLCPV